MGACCCVLRRDTIKVRRALERDEVGFFVLVCFCFFPFGRRLFSEV